MRALAALLVMTPALAAAQTVTLDDLAEGEYAPAGEGVTLPYRLFVPDDVSAPRPLVLFLHGSGERGTDNRRQVTGQSGFLQYVQPEARASHPAFLVAPQLPPGERWVDHVPEILGLLDQVAAERSVDPDRVYATGLSLGGEGVWSLLAEAPERFAAAVPMSGLYRGDGDVIRGVAVPVWNFHAADDDIVPAEDSRVLVTAFADAGGAVTYTEYAVGGHVIWSAAYRTPGLVDWTMAQRRGLPPQGTPGIRLTAPGTSPRIEGETLEADLEGTAAGLGALTELAWRPGGQPDAWQTLDPASPWRLPAAEAHLGAGRTRVDLRATDDAETVIYQSIQLVPAGQSPSAPQADDSGCRSGPDGGAAALLALLGLATRRRRR